MISNLAVLSGTVPNEPQLHELPDGQVVAQFDLVTSIVVDGRGVNQSVPVAWHDPASSALTSLHDGADLVVVGTVRRRFFRVGGATQSRTEVVADTVLPTRRRKQVADALHAAAAGLLG